MSPIPGNEINVEERYHVPGSQVWAGSRGAQRGNIHLHVLEDVKLGRIKRLAGQCLCPKKGGSYERAVDDDDRERTFRCPKCATVAERFGIPWPSAAPPEPKRVISYRKLRGVEARLLGTFVPTSTEVYEAGERLECDLCEEIILVGDRFTRALAPGRGRARVIH